MEGHCSTGQSPQWAVVPIEEEEEEDDDAFVGLNNVPPIFCSGIWISFYLQMPSKQR
jgi:hypothetical protein